MGDRTRTEPHPIPYTGHGGVARDAAQVARSMCRCDHCMVRFLSCEFVPSLPRDGRAVTSVFFAKPPNSRLQRTVIDKVPKVKRGRPAAEPGR